MHEQNFEKQVQQKMEELSLTPSAPVWQKVEGQIRKKRTDWWQAMWLVALLLVTGSAYWLLSGTKDRATSDTTNKVTHTPTALPQQPSSAPVAGNHSKKTTTPSEHRNTATGSQTQTPEAKTQPTTNTLNNNTNRKSSAAVAFGNNTTTPTVNNNSTATLQDASGTKPLKTQKRPAMPNRESIDGKKRMQTTTPSFPDGLASHPKEMVTGEELNTVPPVATESTNIIGTGLASQQEDTSRQTASLVSTRTSATDSATSASKAPGKKTRKWQWAVHAEAGVSSLQSTLFQMPSAPPMYSSPSQSGGGNFFFYNPSPVTDAAGYAAGVTLKRLVNDRLHLTAGVQYNYYSTKREVGQEVRMDTVIRYSTGVQKINNYYRAGTQNSYRNQYHFIQLPVGIEYQLFRKLPLHIHTGVSLARLISTNTLLYDYSLQIYRQNSDAFKKTQWHLFSNITYTLWQGKTKALQVGPYAQYSVTELQKNDAEKNRLFSAGLRTQLSF